MYNQPANLYHFLDNNTSNADFYPAHRPPQIVDYSRSICNSDLMKASSSKFCSICGDNALHSFYGSVSCDACRVGGPRTSLILLQCQLSVSQY